MAPFWDMLERYCSREREWVEISYLMAFVELSRDPILRKDCKMLVVRALSLKGNADQMDFLDHPILIPRVMTPPIFPISISTTFPARISTLFSSGLSCCSPFSLDPSYISLFSPGPTCFPRPLLHAQLLLFLVFLPFSSGSCISSPGPCFGGLEQRTRLSL